MDDDSDILAAFRAWFDDVIGAGDSPTAIASMNRVSLSQMPSWAAVRAAVGAATTINDRPDLYDPDGEQQPSDFVLLESTSLIRAAQSAAHGFYIPVDDLAADFARFCLGPLQPVEDWLLLDGHFPPGTNIAIGKYTLQSFTSDDVASLQPLPSLDPLIARAVLPSPLLDGAAFLQRTSGRRPEREARAFWPLLHTRPEILHWQPLITLLLWRDDVVRMQAVYSVQRGRMIRRLAGDVDTDIRVYETADGDEEIEVQQRGPYAVDADELPQLAAFCAAITTRIDAVLCDARNRATKARARRMARAAEHVVRAAQRTFGGHFVWPEEVDEVVLHYVIAMEALLADSDQLDLSRKVAYRAAALWRTDASRLQVQRIVKAAYDRRSKYAHGDDTGELPAAELAKLRSVATQVVLRWLVLSDDPTFPILLDESQLSDDTRNHIVTAPLSIFFRDTPPSRELGDAGAEQEPHAS